MFPARNWTATSDLVSADGNKSDSDFPRKGKDELNLSDWRISIPQHEQPRTKDGGKLDYVEYVIDRAGKRQMVTIQAPSRIGLPTPVEEDVLIGLIYLSKQDGFEGQLLPINPSELLKVLRWGNCSKDYARLEAALERLVAVTIKYELTWYEKVSAKVLPTHFTGILSEARIVLRKGRRKKTDPIDSHIEWTNNFFSTLRSGNLTDLDLDLYFSLTRPSAKQLYRHLNKRWYAGNKPVHYERDLKEMACGHLGLKNTKFTKRNFHNAVDELEQVGFLLQDQNRYRKVRPGVYRVQFDLNPNYTPSYKSQPQTKSPASKKTPPSDASTALVSAFHKEWGIDRPARANELSAAKELLQLNSLDELVGITPKVAREMRQRFPAAKYFGGSDSYYREELERNQKREDLRAKEVEQFAAQQQEDAQKLSDKKQRAAERKKLLAKWQQLSASQRSELRQQAIENTTSAVLQNIMRRETNLDEPGRATLAYFATTLDGETAQ